MRRSSPSKQPRCGVTTVGLDMGSGAIKAMELAHDADSPEVIRMGLCKVPPEVMTAYASGDPEGMAELLRDFWARQRFGRRTVVIAASQDWVGLQPTLAKDSVSAASNAGRDPSGLAWLPIPREQAMVDAQALPSPGHGIAAAMLVVAAERSRVLAQCTLLELAGLEAGVVDVGAMALRNALIQSHLDAAEGCVAAVDLGYETARVLLLREGVPVMARQLPTEPLPMAIPFAIEKADQLSLAAELFQVVETALDSFRALPGAAWSNVDDGIGQIFVAGGGFMVAGMLESLAEVAGLPVRRIQPFQRVTVSPTADSHGLAADQDLLFVQALGLALRRH